MNDIRRMATDAEYAIVTKDGAIPYADLLDRDFGKCRPDSSNGEFAINSDSCVAFLLDNIARELSEINGRIIKHLKEEHKIDGVPYFGAITNIDKALYEKYGTVKSMISGCNPSRHMANKCYFMPPFEGREYSDILQDHGTPMGFHIHTDFSEDELKGIVGIDKMSREFNPDRINSIRMSVWMAKATVALLVPVLKILQSEGDDEAIRLRFKLLPCGFFRMKKYGVEFKDCPSTILRSPAYVAAAFMAARHIPYIIEEWPRKINIKEALAAINAVDRTKINELYDILFDLHQEADCLNNWGNRYQWRAIYERKAKDIYTEWRMEDIGCEDGVIRFTHELGLISQVQKIGAGEL